MFLAVIFDCFSRKVLSWRLSNTLDGMFCIEALEEALERYGTPDQIYLSEPSLEYNDEQSYLYLNFGLIQGATASSKTPLSMENLSILSKAIKNQSSSNE